MRPRFFVRPIGRNRCHVCDAECLDLPLFDQRPGGKDRPLVFTPEEAAECAARLNALATREQPHEAP